jgi:hypothetical protein
LKVIEESSCGTTLYRLVETDHGPKQIQIWSRVSKSWRAFGRGNVDERWKDKKELNKLIEKRIAERTKPKRKPRAKAKATKSVAKPATKNKKPLRSKKRVVSAGKQSKK